MPPMELMDMESVKCVIENRKWGTLVERIQPVSPANFFYNLDKIFANTGKAWIQASYQKWPKKMPGGRPVRARGANAPPLCARCTLLKLGSSPTQSGTK